MIIKCESCESRVKKAEYKIVYSAQGFKHYFCADCAEQTNWDFVPMARVAKVGA